MLNILIPSAAVLAVFGLIFFFRRKNPLYKKVNAVFVVLLLIYGLLLAQFVLTPINVSYPRDGGVNLIPFRTIRSYINQLAEHGIFTGVKASGLRFIRYGISEAAKNIGANIVFFIPFGLFLALAFSNTKLRWFVIWAWVIPLLIEMWQFFLCTSRVCDIDDIILNTLGIFLGMLPVLICRARPKKRKKKG